MGMPFSYRIDRPNRLAVIELSGTTTGETLLAAHRAVAADPAWQPGFDRLWDYRRIKVLVLLPDDVAMLKEEMRDERYRAGRSASVVESDLQLSIALLFRAMTKQWPVNVFGTLDEALTWLREPPP